MKRVVLPVLGMVALMLMATGCAQNKELIKSNERQRAIIQSLTSEVERLQSELNNASQREQGLAQTQQDLEQKLKEQMAQGDLSIEMKDRGLVVTMLDSLLFDSGKTTIKPTAQKTLETLATSINALDKRQMVYVEGHTDSDPIHYSKFKSNWELSTARATEVVHYLIDKCHVDPAQLAACGYGEFHPVADNATPQGKAKNRRVELIISPNVRVAATKS